MSVVTTMGYSGILLAPAAIGFTAERTGFAVVFVALSGLLVVVCLMARLARTADFAPRQTGEYTRERFAPRSTAAKGGWQARSSSRFSRSDASQQHQDDHHDQDHAENSRGAVAPGARMRPGRNRAQQDQDENDDEDGR